MGAGDVSFVQPATAANAIVATAANRANLATRGREFPEGVAAVTRLETHFGQERRDS